MIVLKKIPIEKCAQRHFMSGNILLFPDRILRAGRKSKKSSKSLFIKVVLYIFISLEGKPFLLSVFFALTKNFRNKYKFSKRYS